MAADLGWVQGLPEDQRQLVGAATYRDIHPGLVQATTRGEWTILDFWDSLAWLKGPGSWTPWRAFVASVFGLPLTAEELEIFQKCTGRKTSPTEQVREAWVPVGRRGRKSATLAVIASFVGAYWDHSSYTAPGEPAVIPILARDKDEAKTIKGFVDTIFRTTALSCLLAKTAKGHDPVETVTLTTGCVLQIKAATIAAGRSKAVPLAILDEVAFFRTGDVANPDKDIVRAIRPAQATVPHPLLLAASSPYARRGELWENYSAHFGKENDEILVWQGATLVMHPGNPHIEAAVASEYAKDPLSAAAEYGAQFRTDVKQFVPEEVVDAATDDVAERERVPGIQYVAFVDPSGGTSDSFALAIAHYEPPRGDQGGRSVLDLVEEWHAPYDPKFVVIECSKILLRYGIKSVEGDRYAGEWPASRFREVKLEQRKRDKVVELPYPVAYHVSDHTKSDLYLNVLPLMNSREARLVKNARLRTQLTGLDRFTARGGRDTVDHAPGAHDDVANAAAGALMRADRQRLRLLEVPPDPPKTYAEKLLQDMWSSVKSDREEPAPTPNRWRRRR